MVEFIEIEPLSSSSCDVGICGEHGMRLHYFITPPFELQKKRHLKLHVIALPPSYQWYQVEFCHLNYTWHVLASKMFSFGSVLKEQLALPIWSRFFLTVCPEREQSNRAGAFTTSAQLPTPKHGKQKHFMSMRKKETVPPTKLRYPTLGSSENHLQIRQTSGGYVSSVVPERATMSCKELSNTLQGTIASPTKREEKNHGLKSTFGMGYLRSRKDRYFYRRGGSDFTKLKKSPTNWPRKCPATKLYPSFLDKPVVSWHRMFRIRPNISFQESLHF